MQKTSKKLYARPTVKEYGVVRELTQSGSGHKGGRGGKGGGKGK